MAEQVTNALSDPTQMAFIKTTDHHVISDDDDDDDEMVNTNTYHVFRI